MKLTRGSELEEARVRQHVANYEQVIGCRYGSNQRKEEEEQQEQQQRQQQEEEERTAAAAGCYRDEKNQANNARTSIRCKSVDGSGEHTSTSENERAKSGARVCSKLINTHGTTGLAACLNEEIEKNNNTHQLAGYNNRGFKILPKFSLAADGQRQEASRELAQVEIEGKLARKDKYKDKVRATFDDERDARETKASVGVSVASGDSSAIVAPASGSRQREQSSKGETQGQEQQQQTSEKQIQSENKEKRASLLQPPASSQQTQRKGFLEALLGDRGKSWFEHKTVVLEIQNGNLKNQTSDKKESDQQVDQFGHVEVKKENSKETYEKLEELPARNRQLEQQTQIRESDADKSSNKLPTFGTIPQKLTRLPYFTYHGQTQRKLKISKHDERHAEPEQDQHNNNNNNNRKSNLSLLNARQKSNSIASLNYRASPSVGVSNNKSGKSRQSASSTGSTSGASTGSGSVTTTATSGSANERTFFSRRSASSARNKLGFSNISNLFPNERANVRLSTSRHQRQAALPLRTNNSSNSNNIGDNQRQQQQQRYRVARAGAELAAAAAREARERHTRPTWAQRDDEPKQVALSERRESHFSSLSPMTRRNSFATLQQQQQQQQDHRAAQSTERSQFKLRAESQQSLLAQNEQLEQRRQMATLRRQQLNGGGGSFVGQQQQQQHKYLARGRPVSATGSYLGGAHRRSPSASSLRYQQQHRLGSAGMSPLVDPDCPVHGDSPEMGAPSGRRRYTSEYTGGGHYSMSQPDLLFASGGGGGGDSFSVEDREDPYNKAQGNSNGGRYYDEEQNYPIYDSAYQHLSQASNVRGRAAHQKTPLAQCSPVSPSMAARGQARKVNNQPPDGAYYDGPSRFSLYHPASESGALYASRATRSALAPTGEQLRRILGYKPANVPRPVHLHPQWAYTRPFIHLKPAGSGFGRSPTSPGPMALVDSDGNQLDDVLLDYDELDDVPKFAPFNRLQDTQAIRAVDFHPSGEVYAIGSNSRALRICAYPAEHELRHFDPPSFEPQQQQQQQQQQTTTTTTTTSSGTVKAPRVLFKFLQVHRGSIYCVSFSPSGQLLATGSNDQTVHIVKYNSITHNPDGEEFRLTMHNGTIRDLCFIDDSSGNGSSLLLSAGGGDNKIYVTDCDTITPFQSMAGHTQMVMALNHCGGAQFVSGSYDRTIRFWDLRSRSCTSIVSAPPTSPTMGGGGGLASGPGAPVCALRVDPSGRLLASGHTDSTCMLYDIRGAKIIQTFRPHDDEIRAISFSPKSYYLLTGGYDGRLVVSDLQGDLTQPLPSACVAESQDKIVQAKWHPADFTFVSTSADKSATLWSLPGEIRN